MFENELNNLDNKELIELLATLEGMDDALSDIEKSIKEGSDNFENEY